MTLLLRHPDLIDLLTQDEVIQAVRASLVEQAEGQVQVPNRITVDSASGHGWLRLMPAIMNRSGYMGFKAMNATPGRGVRYMVALYELSSGALLAQMDADWLTQQRTASVAAVGTDALARQPIQEVAVLGSSHQARALLGAVMTVRTPSSLRVFSPTPENRDRFAQEVGEQYGVRATGVGSAEEAIVGADLVLSAIRAGAAPVLHAAWLKEGAHVTAISAVRPEARELSEDVWRRASLAVVDDREHAFDSGDGRAALAAGAVRAEDVAELWELVGGRRPGRRAPDDVTLFKSVGTGLQDIAIAIALYRRAVEEGRGEDLGEFPQARLQGSSR